MTDPLNRLVADGEEVDRELLANALQNVLRLDLTRGAFAFLHGVRERLNSRQQVIAALLGQKALHLLREELAEGLRPQPIEQATGIPGGTLRPILKVLVERRLVRQDADKLYLVPSYAVEDAVR